jgi:hypothetical protein
MQQFYKFITWRSVSLNTFRAPPRPSSGAYNCIKSLWFYRWSVVVAAVSRGLAGQPDVGRCPTRFLLRLFARCRSLSDTFPHVVTDDPVSNPDQKYARRRDRQIYKLEE